MISTIEIGGEQYQYSTEAPYKDPDLLQKLYWEEGMSQYDIADAIGCDRSTVARWMDNLDVESRKPTSERPSQFLTNQGYERWNSTVDGVTKEVTVHRLLAVAKYGFDAVCGMDVHHRNSIKWDNRSDNIELLDPKEHRRHHNDERHNHDETPWRNEDTLRKMYCVKEMNMAEIAERWGCSTVTVSNWIEKHGIEKRSLSEAQKIAHSNNTQN